MIIEIFPTNAKSFLVGCIYRPPDGSRYLPRDFDKNFEQILIAVNSLSIETIILGDLNVNYLKQHSGKELKNMITLNGFKQLIKGPTRITAESSTLIDVILSNNESSIAKTDVAALSLSDHDIIGCVHKLNHQQFSPRTITCRNYTNYNPNSMCEELLAHDMGKIYSINDVNAAWLYLRNILHTVFNKHAPIITKRVKGRHCPWLTTEVKKQINKKDQLLRKARRSNSKEDWQLYKTARNRCNNDIRKTKGNYHKSVLNENMNNPRNFWKAIKAVFPGNKGTAVSSSSMPFLDGLPTEGNEKSKANTFCKFFTSIAKTLKEKAQPLKNFVWGKPTQIDMKTHKHFQFGYVSKVFIEKELKSLKRHKATGLDDLPSNLLKDGATIIAKPLSHVINLSLKTGIVPSEWKVAKITPLHKSGDKTKADNYRPISILPVLSKILEKAVHKQLIAFLEENNLLQAWP